MAHFGVLSYKGTGHINPLIALSRQLVRRGHRVTFFQKPELEARLHQHGLEFSPIGGARPSDKYARTDSRDSSPCGIASLRPSISRIVADMEMTLREAPSAISRAGVDALIIDEIVLSGPTLAQMLHLPYFVVSTSIPHIFGWSPPRELAGYGDSAFHLPRRANAFVQLSVFCMLGPVRWRLDEYRRELGLGPIRKIRKVFPELAHIAQLPLCLDFPRPMLPANFYYAGPFVDKTARPFVEFPWNRLDERPFIYASLGTARKVRPTILRLISEACKRLELQLVISLGGRRDEEVFEDLPGYPLVVRDAPQLKLLERAAIVITHGGLNTVLEALMEGKPMIVIPLDYDQPAVAARVAWLKVGEVLPVESISTEQLCLTVEKIVNNSSYRDAAMKLQSRILETRGVEVATIVIEDALEKYAGNQRANSERVH